MSGTDFLSRSPVQDLEAESSILGSILLNPVVALVEVLETGLLPADFHSERHRQIFEAMLRLWGDEQPIDAVTVTAELRARRHESAVADGYLADVAAYVPTAGNAAWYGRIVHELALVRDLGREAYQIALDSLDRREAAEFLTSAQSRFDRVHSRLLGVPEPSTPETFAKVFAEMRDDRRPPRLPTGLRGLDAALGGGMGRGEVIVTAGSTGQGKSASALNVCVHLAKLGFGVLYVSLEMPPEQLIERALCAEARVNLTAHLRGLGADEIGRLDDATRRLAATKLEIRYRPGLGINALRAMVQKAQRDWGSSFALVVIDYLGLMRSDRREERREREIASITMALKHLAGDMNVAVMALSQLSRAPDRREDRTPRLSDLRDSGSVEQDADIVLFLHEKQNDGGRELRDVEVIVAKNRNGLCWVGIPVHFVANQTRFEDRNAP